MSVNIDLLKKLCEASGAPGFENKIRSIVFEEVKDCGDEITKDNLGNLIVTKKSRKDNPSKLLIAAHMDEIGFIVKHIDDNGFIRFHPLGGFDPKTLTAQRVIVHGKEDLIGVMGTKPIHVMKAEERSKNVQIEDFFIDTGLSGDKVKEIIQVGDPITRERELIEMGDCVNCKSLDNRVSVYILVEVLKRLKEIDLGVDLYGVFTVQEEVGLRGAGVVTHSINPDFGLAIDTTIAYDLPGAQDHEKITEFNKGTAIKVMDAMTICDPRMVSFLKQTAEKNSINWQLELLTAGGTDTAGLQRHGKSGAIAGAVSIPTRYLHQVIEMCHKNDIKSSIDLIVKAAESIDSYEW